MGYDRTLLWTCRYIVGAYLNEKNLKTIACQVSVVGLYRTLPKIVCIAVCTSFMRMSQQGTLFRQNIVLSWDTVCMLSLSIGLILVFCFETASLSRTKSFLLGTLIGFSQSDFWCMKISISNE